MLVADSPKFARRQTLCRGAPMWAPNRRTATWGRPYTFFLMFLILAIAISLSACGKKGAPEPPDPKTDQFPRQYPDPNSL